jgi:uncharacterized membrane protein
MARGYVIKARARAGVHQMKHGHKPKHEFAWIKGGITPLIAQDFIGASFGAMFFVVTAEVWELAAALQALNVFAIAVMSLMLGFGLVYLSARRRAISVKIEHTAALRAVEIYAVSFLTALLFVLVFNTAAGADDILKQTVVITLPSVVSAATADLLFY